MNKPVKSRKIVVSTISIGIGLIILAMSILLFDTQSTITAHPTTSIVIPTPSPTMRPDIVCNPDASELKSGLVTFWFDDGYRSVYDNAAPLLEKLGYQAVMALVADQEVFSQKIYADEKLLNKQEADALYDMEWEISSHSLSHQHIQDVSDAQILMTELTISRMILSARGYDVNFFTAPYGEWNDQALKISEIEYLGYRVLTNRINPLPIEDFLLRSFYITKDTTITEIEEWIKMAEESDGWLILTLHSVVDEPVYDWEMRTRDFQRLLETVCESNLTVVTASEAMVYSAEKAERLKPPHLDSSRYAEIITIDLPTIEVSSRLHSLTDAEGIVDFSSLQEDVMWISSTREIGLPGVSMMLGHRQWGISPKVFAKLNEVQIDDEVEIKTQQGESFVYQVTEIMESTPDELWMITFDRDGKALENGNSQIMLVTCTPYGTSLRRILVFADLVRVDGFDG